MKLNKWLLAAVFALVFIPGAARADVSLLVLEAVGAAGEFTGSGHAGVYFSNICVETPVRLRLCKPGEQGAVITTYPLFGKGLAHEWMAVPLNFYLYGVADEKDIPIYANSDIRDLVRERYHRRYLSKFIPRDQRETLPEGRWQAMLTLAYNRDIYSLNIQTTVGEDARFLHEFNSLPNKGDYSTFTRNCADFVKKTINRYFPGSTRRDVLNDFGISTPKAIARSFTRYARKRPHRLFHINRYSQIAGPIWRSHKNRNFTEMAITSKKYAIPTLIFDPPLYAIFAAVYLTTGRFDLHRAYVEYATPRIAGLNLERHYLKDSTGSEAQVRTTSRMIDNEIERERLQLLGDKQTWDAYRAKFAPILGKAIAHGLFQDAGEVTSFFRDLQLQSEPEFDKTGDLILNVRNYGENRTLGVTRQNIIGPDSDKELALKLILARINDTLDAPERDRSSLLDFKADWRLMRRLLGGYYTISLPTVAKGRGRFLRDPRPTSLRWKMEKLLINLTH